MSKLERANFYFDIQEEDYEKTGAFNPVIGIDNEFFIDPLLMEKTSVPELKDGLKNVRNYFKEVITLIRSGNSRATRKALRKLKIPEVKGVGIGYGQADDGSAIGEGLAKQIYSTISELLEIGIDDPAIFEVMGVFEENFGPDRLSDSIIYINKEGFYKYTNRIAKELGIKCLFRIEKYSNTYYLPKHPISKKPFIFVPSDILRDLPIANNWEEICSVAAFNEELRERFNKFLAPCFAGNEKIKKVDIRKYIFSNKDNILTLVDLYKSVDPSHYDFEKDDQGIYKWLEKSKDIFDKNPITLRSPSNQGDLEEVVNEILSVFKKFIEIKGGWRILYNNSGVILNERHARLVFYCISLLYGQKLNFDVSPESNAGSGPVDFKLSRGEEKIVVEVKLTTGKVRQGYEKQTRLYEESEDAIKSIYLVIRVTESMSTLKKILQAEKEQEENEEKHPIIYVVDGRKKLSASNA